jgi:hypothetical protein
MEWLAEQLEAAKAAEQKVIVFVHYRLDGGPGGPVNCSASTGKNAPLLRHFILKMTSLPLQARDKHSKNSKKSGVFSYSVRAEEQPRMGRRLHAEECSRSP